MRLKGWRSDKTNTADAERLADYMDKHGCGHCGSKRHTIRLYCQVDNELIWINECTECHWVNAEKTLALMLQRLQEDAEYIRELDKSRA